MNKVKEKNLMIIEDDPTLRMLLSYMVKMHRPQINIIECENGKDALMNMTSDIQLIFTDNNMPILTGVEFMLLVKEDPRYSHIPIVMVSIDSRPEYISMGLKTGFSGWVVKPFQREQIIEYLNKYA